MKPFGSAVMISPHTKLKAVLLSPIWLVLVKGSAFFLILRHNYPCEAPEHHPLHECHAKGQIKSLAFMVLAVWTVPPLMMGRLLGLIELTSAKMNNQLPLSLNIPSNNIIRLTGTASAYWIGRRTGIGEGLQEAIHMRRSGRDRAAMIFQLFATNF